MTLKIKNILGMEFWDGIPDDIVFHDPDSPTYQDLTKEEFNGFIKGINVYDDENNHYSTESEEYNKYYEELKSLLPEGEKILASFSGGVLVGFRILPDILLPDIFRKG